MKFEITFSSRETVLILQAGNGEWRFEATATEKTSQKIGKIADQKIMDSQLLRAEELGIRLEIVAGLPVWEASPVIKHQLAVDRIRESINKSKDENKSCDCFHIADIYIKFPDESLKRPDISIFCRMPEETDEAVTEIPQAVIEIISKGYEKKDLEIGVPFYLANGVKDVLVFNPYTDEVLHFCGGEKRGMTSPVEIEFDCGCSCTV